MTAPDLKPCPFCGGNKTVICKTDYGDGDAYAVSCRYHECHGAIFTLGYGYFSTEAEAIAAWNTRAIDPAAIREAALREAAALAEALAVKWWAEYKDRLSPHCADPQYQGMSDGAGDAATAIEALIGEKK